MNEIALKFNDDPVRAFVDENGESAWIASDACKLMDVSNVSKALGRLDDDEKFFMRIETSGGIQRVLMVTEPGLMSLILSSRTDRAKQFKRWVTHEVLPSLRKTGRYEMAKAETQEEEDPGIVELQRHQVIIERMIEQRRQIKLIQSEIKDVKGQLTTVSQKVENAENLATAAWESVNGETHYRTIVGYGVRHGWSIDVRQAANLGRILSRYCRENNIVTGKSGHEKFDSVNTYPLRVLEEHHKLIESRCSKHYLF